MISRHKKPQKPFFSREEKTAHGTIRVEADTYIEENIISFINQLMKGELSTRDKAMQLAKFVEPFGIKTTSICESGSDNWLVTFSQKEE